MSEIVPETISQYTGMKDDNNTKIFENDIVEIVSSGGNKFRYLIWFNREMCALNALPIEYLAFNGCDYWSEIYHNFSFEDFSLLLQDPYGENKKTEVIGNIFDNSNLLENKKIGDDI